MIALKIIYIANVIVAGWVGISALFFPETAVRTVFSNIYPSTDAIRLIGALWLAIALMSLLGLWRPVSFSPVLILQLLYKGMWLLIVAVPALMSKTEFPKEMAFFFTIWVFILPFVIPWKEILNA